MTTPPLARILIVDDEGDLLQVLQFVLEEEGYDVLTATNGADALQLVSPDTVDLVILDMSMTKMSGFEVAQQLRANEKTSRVAIAVHTGLPEDAVRARFSDYDVYMRKVDDVSVLVGAIRQAIQKGRSRQVGNPQAN
ncbi:MAG: response regulator [Pseudomonadota bacterium]|nr:response regulator [Pseudomonadota bacterium]